MNFTRFTRNISQGLGIFALALSTHSAFAASDWQINSLGTGAGAASGVSSVNVGGVGYVQLLPSTSDAPFTFTFVENGAYRILAADGSPFGGNDLTAIYSAVGSGSQIDPSALHMNGGHIDLYSDSNFDFASSEANYGADNGKLIASFNITGGHVADAQGTVAVQATGIAGSFAQGYLFTANGTDMANLSGVQLQLNLANSPIVPSPLVISEIVCGLANACPGGSVILSPAAFTVQDTGTVSISAVPEPESAAMLLAGLGLIAAIARRRRPAFG